jgi:hypothetical protein
MNSSRSAMPSTTLNVGSSVRRSPDIESAIWSEQIVTAGRIHVEAAEGVDIIEPLHGYVTSIGGRIVLETVGIAGAGEMKLRLPPQSVENVIRWFGQRGVITERNITAIDVSRDLFEQDLAITNQQAALDRLTKLLDQGGLAMADVLSIEKEMTRIRGSIEEMKGNARFLKDRVATATLTVSIAKTSNAAFVAEAKAYPGLRLAALTVLSTSQKMHTRLGAGFVVHSVLRRFSLEVDIFGAVAPAKSRAAIATLGGAFYSDFSGRGQRRFMNPFLGYRIGYGYLDSSRFVGQLDVGLELIKTRHAVVDVSVRATGLIGSNTDLGFVSGVGAVVAF